MPAMAAIVLVTGVGPFGTDTYLAALPELQRSLSTSATVAQLSITVFIVGNAVGQLVLGPVSVGSPPPIVLAFVLGPVSDGRGRRRLLLIGALVFTVASLGCAAAPTGAALLGLRLVQGFVAGGGVAIGRAVVSDLYTGTTAAARYGTLAAITFVGPVIAPAIGAVVLAVAGWREVFLLLAALGGAMTVGVVVGMPETLPPQARQTGGLAATAARVRDLLADRRFMRHVVVQCLATAGFFAYVGGSSFVFETAYGISQTRYAVIFATNAAAMSVASVLFRVLVARVGPPRLRTVGLLVSTAGGLGLLAVALLDRGADAPLALPWVLTSVVVAGMGWCIPGTTAIAQEVGRRSRGTASALQGGLGFLAGAATTPLTGVLGYATLLPMAALVCGLLVAATVWLVLSGSARPLTADR